MRNPEHLRLRLLPRLEHFRVLKEYETSNRIVPLVGDFAGDRTVRAVGRYLRDHDVKVAAFYTSNVEGYLFQGDRWPHVPHECFDAADRRAQYVRRANFTVTGYTGARPAYGTSTVPDPMGDLVPAFRRGDIQTSSGVRSRGKASAR
jgi:hypothetical protein